jgi:acetyl esterase/lipase
VFATASAVLLATAVLAAVPSGALAAGAPALPSGPYHDDQVGLPTGKHAGHRPRGWILVVHGGGWRDVGAVEVQSEVPTANFFRAHGWATYNIDYYPYARSLGSVLAAYQALRNKVGRRTRICAWGESAGSQLVLMLAGMRHALHCVMTQGTITDLVRLPHEPAHAPRGQSRYAGPEALFRTDVVPAFGSSHRGLWAYSPVRLAHRIRARMLLSASRCDPKVPHAQDREMKARRPGITRIVFLACGKVPYTHAGISRAAAARWHRAELALLRR